MQYRIHEGGSLDLAFGKLKLLSAYPAVDGVPVRPLKTETTQASARYTLPCGFIEIRIREEDGLLVLSCRTEGLDSAHTVSPLGSARPTGCDRVFVQGLGIAGPSGFHPLADSPLTSHSLICAGDGEESFVIYARRQDRLHNVYTVEKGLLKRAEKRGMVQASGGQRPGKKKKMRRKKWETQTWKGSHFSVRTLTSNSS